MSVLSLRFPAALQQALCARLRELRLAAGLSQEQVAQATGSHRAIVARTERGVSTPSLENAILFAEVCGGSFLDVTETIDRVIAEHTLD